jgi:glycosyltransferase involved in cell wall biosynthesis
LFSQVITGDEILEITLLTIAGFIYILLIIAALTYYILSTRNGKHTMEKEPFGKLKKEPFVSIIVPTFNEEHNIQQCLESLKNLEYNNYELIVSDGGSSDQTVKITEKYADKIIVDSELPNGWIGKNWGCHIASLEAQGDWLLFTDADTYHRKDSLRKTIQTAMETDAALLTMLPYQKLEKWWESITPIFYFASNLTQGGKGSVNDPNKLDFYTASGQYMLFRRNDYDKIGGHKIIKGSIVEDLAFARVVKTHLNGLYCMSNQKLVSTRMYPDSLKQCWSGWKKALYAGTKLTNTKRIFGSLLWILWGIFAPLAITIAVLYSTPFYIVLTSLSYLICGFSFWTYWKGKGRQYWLVYLLFPILLIVFCLMLAVSALELILGKTTTWRNRRYEPDLYAGITNLQDAETKTNILYLGQLATDREIEIIDQIVSQHELVESPKILSHNKEILLESNKYQPFFKAENYEQIKQ